MNLTGPANLLPTDNELGIPSLSLSADAGRVVAPVIGWGTLGRTRKMLGTYHCYVDDAKFAGLLRNPLAMVESGCVAACEPNVSIYDHTPPYLAHHAIGIKRAASAAWAAAGVGVFVDMCVPERYAMVNLYGVPHGWRSYSTRGFRERPEDVEREYQVALGHSSGNPILLVIGGGEIIRRVCLGLPGAIHVAATLGSEAARNAQPAAVETQRQGDGD